MLDCTNMGVGDGKPRYLHILQKQPVVIYSVISTDDSSNSQSSLETEGRNVHSAREASKRTKGLTGDHEGIFEDLMISLILACV